MYYVPKYFQPFEFLPPDMFQKYGADGLYFMDDRITWTLDKIREYFGKHIIVNTWKFGGQFSQRGYRNDQNTGAPFSAHRFGRAVDFDIEGVKPQEFRDAARALKINLPYITRIEDATTWNHIDCMGLPKSNGDSIVFFKP